MTTKGMVWLGLLVGLSIGGLIGTALDNGNLFSMWSILLGGVGGIAGIWAGFKIGQ